MRPSAHFAAGALYGRIETAISALNECVNNPNETNEHHPDYAITASIKLLESIKATILATHALESKKCTQGHTTKG